MKLTHVISLSIVFIVSCGSSQLETYHGINKSPSISAYGDFANNTTDESLKKKADLEAYKLAEKENNEQSYNEYLKYFQNGIYAQYANNKLNELKMSKEYRAMVDSYNNAVTENTLQSYIAFLQNYSGFDTYEAIEFYSNAYSSIYYFATKDEIRKLQKSLLLKKWDAKLLETEIEFKPIWENEDKNKKERLIDFLYYVYQNPSFVNISHSYNSNSRLLTIKIKFDIETVEIIFRKDAKSLVPRKHTIRNTEKFDQDACIEILGLYENNRQLVHESIRRKYHLIIE